MAHPSWIKWGNQAEPFWFPRSPMERSVIQLHGEQSRATWKRTWKFSAAKWTPQRTLWCPRWTHGLSNPFQILHQFDQPMITPSLDGWRSQLWVLLVPRSGTGSWTTFAIFWGSIVKMEWWLSSTPTAPGNARAVPMKRVRGLGGPMSWIST